MSGEREDLDPGAVSRTQRFVPVGTFFDDQRQVGEGFNIIHHGWFAIQAVDGRERRADAGHAAFALDGLEQGGLFTADVSARAQMGINVQGILRAEEAVAQETGLLHFRNLFIQNGCQRPELAAQVDVAGIGPDGIAGNGNPLQELQRIVFHNLAVLEGARF